MGAKKSIFTLSKYSFAFSIVVLLSAFFILSGCLGLQREYRQPDSSGRMSHRVYNGNIYYLDHPSLFGSGNFAIRNKRGQVIFRVRGTFFSRSTRISLVNRSGNELFTITKSGSRYRPQYRIYSYGNLIAKVHKKRTARYERFYLNARRGKDYIVRGDFSGRIYSFYYRGYQVAQVAKVDRGFSNRYRVDISRGQNNLMILATTIIIDMENSYIRR